jgi:hypothetical protein
MDRDFTIVRKLVVAHAIQVVVAVTLLIPTAVKNFLSLHRLKALGGGGG